jgi:primosomal replication protein N
VNAENRLCLSGTLCEKKPLRHTPAGVPVAEARIAHESRQIEAGQERLVICELSVKALGEAARWLHAAPLGVALKAEGFLAAKSKSSRVPVLHLCTIEFLKGNEHGPIHEEEGR